MRHRPSRSCERVQGSRGSGRRNTGSDRAGSSVTRGNENRRCADPTAARAWRGAARLDVILLMKTFCFFRGVPGLLHPFLVTSLTIGMHRHPPKKTRPRCCGPVDRGGVREMRALFFALLRDNSGATAIEYGLIAILVSVAALGAISAIGSWV